MRDSSSPPQFVRVHCEREQRTDSEEKDQVVDDGSDDTELEADDHEHDVILSIRSIAHIMGRCSSAVSNSVSPVSSSCMQYDST